MGDILINFVVMKRIILYLLVWMLTGIGVSAAELQFAPTGRVLFDAAMYLPQKDGFANGITLPDIRLGGTARYGQWLATANVGFGYGKLTIMDMYMQYNFKDTKNYLRGGYFIHQFGLSSATSGSFKPAGEAPVPDQLFGTMVWRLGLMYVMDRPQFFMGVSGFTDTGMAGENTATRGYTSAGLMGRFVYRPLASTGSVVQVGISPWLQSAVKKDVGGKTVSNYDCSVYFPTRVARVPMMKVDVTDASSVFKISPELLLSKGRFALESQYYWMNVSRHAGLPDYKAQGVYGLFRALIKGDSKYTYSSGTACLELPSPKTLECVLGYGYTDGISGDILGGISNDYSVTLNYYINKYMLCRLGYHYTDVRDSSVAGRRHINILQARIQFKF